MADCSTLLVTVLIASVGEALPEIIQSIPKDSESRLYGVEACGGWGPGVEAEQKKKRRKKKEKKEKSINTIQLLNTQDLTVAG